MADLFKISLFILLAVTFTHVTCRDNWKGDDVFNEIDSNPVDGQVSTRELTEYLEQFSDDVEIKFGELAAGYYVSAGDTDGDGYLNHDELNDLPFA